MWVQLLPSACVIIRATPEEAKWASSILKIEDKAAMEARKYMINVPKGGKILTLDLSWRDPSGRICFPCGLLPVICKAAHKVNITVEVVDKREMPPQSAPFEDRLAAVSKLCSNRYYQDEALTALELGRSSEADIQFPVKGRGIIKLPTGCHAKGQLILMHDGSSKPVEDIAVGDLVMGWDNSPRKVLELHRGVDAMVKITPVKGEAFIVNNGHVLTLKRTNDGKRLKKPKPEYVDVPVFLWKTWNKHNKHLHKIVRSSGIELPPQEVPIDPYILGVFIGDGALQHGIIVASIDSEIQGALIDYSKNNGLTMRTFLNDNECPHHVLTTQRGKPNPALNHLGTLGLRCKAGDKHIPDAYKQNSKEIRLALLAGLIDTDGSLSRRGFDYISKSKKLANDVAWLARSVGLAAYVTECTKSCQTMIGIYWRVSISGDTRAIPTKISRKKAACRLQKKAITVTGFSIEDLEFGDYYGFTIEGDGRYLMGDFTITHNSGKGNIAAALPLVFEGKWCFAVHRSHLAADIAERFERMTGEKAGWIAEGRFEPGDRFTCATIQTLHTLIHTPQFKEWATTINGFCLDECHTAAAETHSAAASAFPNIYWKVGLSGTPLDRADKKSIMAVAAIGPIVYEKKPGELIDEGFLAAPTVKIIPCHQPKHPGNWTELYNDHIKNSPHRNSAIVAAMLNSEAPGIVFVKHLEHGKTLCKMARAKGIECDFVHGSWSRTRRQEVIKRLDRGEISWIVASAVFAEGVDIPCLRTVINGGGGKAIIATLQQVGRGTRLAEGKTTFTVWDIGDKGDERLNNHARARIRACQREGYKCVVDSALWPEKAKRIETV